MLFHALQSSPARKEAGQERKQDPQSTSDVLGTFSHSNYLISSSNNLVVWLLLSPFYR